MASRHIFTTFLLAVLLAVASAGRVLATDLYVPTDYPTIQSAVAAAAESDQVIVASGVYTGAGNVDVDFLGKTITVRSATLNPADCVIDCENSARGFRFVSGEKNSILNGFTITHANPASGAGAIEVTGLPTIDNCRFVDNSTTGIYVHDDADDFGNGAQLWIVHCDFRNNTTGVFVGEHGMAMIHNCLFDANTRAGVDGSCIGSNYAEIAECTFTNHSIGIRGYDDNFAFNAFYPSNCVFDGNQIGLLQLVPFADHCQFLNNATGARSFGENGDGDLYGCHFEGNGIGFDNQRSYSRLWNCEFVHNGTAVNAWGPTMVELHATIIEGNSGWGLDVADAERFQQTFIRIENCRICGNGGGVRIAGASDPFGGSTLAVYSSTIAGNTQGGLLIDHFPFKESPFGYSEIISDLILWGNGVADLNGAFAVYSDIGTGNTAGTGNLSANPLFVRDPNSGTDGIWGTPDDDYGDLHLQTGSPCIDAGSASSGGGFDLDGNPRFAGSALDMGCYEVQVTVARAGSDQTVTVAHDGTPATNTAAFTLDGSASTGLPPLTYEWSEGGTVVGSTAKLTLSRPAGTYTFTLTVTGSTGVSATDDVVVTVQPEPNGTPTANAGPDQLFHSSSAVSVTLDGSASSDPDGDPLIYVWSEGGTEIATGQKPAVLFSPGTHTVTLTVTDPYGASNSDTVTITVAPPENTVQLTSLSKTSCYAGETAPTITATGAGFKPGAVLTWDGTPMPTIFLAKTGQLRAQLTSAQIAVAGIFQIGVQNPDGATSNTLPFTVKNRAPYLAALDPASVKSGSAMFTLNVTGDRFVPGTVFLWKGTARPTTVVSSTLLQVTIYDTDVANAGNVTVWVSSPGPGGGGSNKRTFYVLP